MSKCLITGVKIGELKADLFETLGTLNCKYAFTITDSGKTCGYGNFNQWSEETISKFKQLVKSMEADIEAVMFESTTPTDGISETQETTEDGVPGL